MGARAQTWYEGWRPVKRIRSKRPVSQRAGSRLEVLPLDPRDPGLCRAKAVARAGNQRAEVTST